MEPSSREATKPWLDELISLCGHEAIASLSGNRSFLIFTDHLGHLLPTAEQCRAIARAVADEIQNPAAPWAIPHHSAIDQLNRLAAALEAVKMATEGMPADLVAGIGIDIGAIASGADMATFLANNLGNDPHGQAVHRDHQTDMAQHGMARRIDTAMRRIIGQPSRGHAVAIAGLVEAITGRPCAAFTVRRWLKQTESG